MNWDLVIAITCVLTLIGSVGVQFAGRARWTGEVGTRLTRTEKDITELKSVDNRQWKTIGEHGEKIAALQAGRGKANSHGII